MSIGTRIKERREALGITQVQLAEKLGVSKGAIGNYETDANSPKASILYKVFEVLECDANYLFQDEIREKLPLSEEAMNVAVAYDKADEKSKEIVRVTLAEYMQMGRESLREKLHKELDRQLDLELEASSAFSKRDTK